MSSNQQPSGIFYTNDDDVGFEPCRQDQRRLQQQQAHHCLQQMQCSNESIDIGNEACRNTTTTRRLSNHPSYQHSQQQRYHLRPDQQRQSLVRRDKRNDSPATPLNLPQSNSGMEQQQAVEPQPSVSFNPISEDNSHSFLDDLMWWCSNDTTNGSFSEGTHHNASTNNVSVSHYMNESSPPPPPARAAAAVPNTVASNGIITPNPYSLKTPTSSILSSYRQYLSSFTNSNRDSKPTSNNSTNNKGSFVHSNNRTKTSFHTYMLPRPIEGRLQQDVYIAPTWAGWISQHAQSCGCHYTNPLASHSSTEWSYEAPGNDEVFSPMDVFPGGEKEDNMDDHGSMTAGAVSRHSRDGQLYTTLDGGSVPMPNSSFESDQHCRNPTAFMTPSRETSQIQQRPPPVTPYSAGQNQGHMYSRRPLSPSQFDPILRILPPGQLRQPVAAVVSPAMMQAHAGNTATLNPPPATITPGRFGSGPSQLSANHWNASSHNGGYVSNHLAVNDNSFQDSHSHHQGSVQLPNQPHPSANTAFDGEIAAGEAYNEMNNMRDSSDMEVDLELQDMDPYSNPQTGFEVILSGDLEPARVIARPNSTQGNLLGLQAPEEHESPITNGPGRPTSMPDPKQLSYSTLENMDSKPPAIRSPENHRMGQEDHGEGGNFQKESQGTDVPTAAGMPHRGPSRNFLSYMKATHWDVKLPPPPSASAADAQPCSGKDCLGSYDRKMNKINRNNFVPPPTGAVGSSTAISGGARPAGQKVGRQTRRNGSSSPFSLRNIRMARMVAGFRQTKQPKKKAPIPHQQLARMQMKTKTLPRSNSNNRGKTSSGSDKNKRIRKPKIPKEKRVYTEPTANDILCGRGGGSNHNPANKRYRERILAEQKIYQALYDPEFPHSKSKADKVKQAYSREFLVREKTFYKSRFLDKDDIGWYEIDDEAARQKIGQALREDHTEQGKEAKKSRSAQGKGGAKKEQKKGKKKKDSK